MRVTKPEGLSRWHRVKQVAVQTRGCGERGQSRHSQDGEPGRPGAYALIREDTGTREQMGKVRDWNEKRVVSTKRKLA